MRRFGLIGKNLDFTQSKRVHAEIGDYEYELIEVEREEEIETILSDTDFDGFNVTHPYRNVIISYLDELSFDAERSGSANVIKRLPDGRLKGYNTDMNGFRYLLNDIGEGRRCLILGTGAAARSASEVLKDLGAYEIILVSHDPQGAAKRLGDGYKVTGYDTLYRYYDAGVIVNCTSTGKFPDIERSPFSDTRVSMRQFSKLELAVDLIYNPYRTKFLQDAKRLTGCYTKSGLDMLIIQALHSRNIWYDEDPDAANDADVINRVKRNILEKQLNVVAVGLPGSGKTTIFRRYAYELGLKFIDTDEETEKLMGDSIANVLSSSGIGEEYFRAMEHQAVRDTSSVMGAVIATGGGTLLNPINRDILKANGIVVYVKRPLDMLTIKGRPISINIDLKDMFSARDRIYRRVADMTLLNSRIFGDRKARTGEGNSYNYELKGFVYFISRKVQKHLNMLAADKWI